MTQKIIGMLGGMSWKSSAEYYRLINEGVRDRLGGLHPARCLMWSFDFDDIAVLQRDDRWIDAAGLMVEAARRLERGGADFLVIRDHAARRPARQPRAAVRHDAPARGGGRRPGARLTSTRPARCCG